jgi:nitrate reductase gamma subunit
MEAWQVMLYALLPYAAITAFVVGHVWRYRYDQYHWTSRSSQMLESRWLRYGSVAFHYGAFAAIAGHVLGVLVPASWTDAAGISEDAYHVISAVGGLTAGVAVTAGLAILVWRRARIPRVRVVTKRMDVIVFALLAVGILSGMAVTILNSVADSIHYRENVAPWFRSLFALDPDVEAMGGAHWVSQLHVTSAWFLYALWPFSRLVHAWSIPVDWFRRSPVLFRGRPGPTRRARRPQPVARSGAR